MPDSLIIYIPRVEVLRPSTLGWGTATPTELPLLMGSQWVGYGLFIGINYVDVVGVGLCRSWLVRTSGNSDGVAIS